MNYVFTLDCLFSGWFHLGLRSNSGSTNQYGNVLLSYVNETMYLLGNLPFFKIHVNHFMAWDDSPCANAISKMHVVGEWPATLRVLRHFLYLISSLLLWRRKWQHTPVLPGEFHGLRSLVGYSSWGLKESD